MPGVPARSRFLGEMGRRATQHGSNGGEAARGTWCTRIWAIGEAWWTRGESNPLESYEEACTE
jgi:hypothetical protein